MPFSNYGPAFSFARVTKDRWREVRRRPKPGEAPKPWRISYDATSETRELQEKREESARVLEEFLHDEAEHMERSRAMYENFKAHLAADPYSAPPALTRPRDRPRVPPIALAPFPAQPPSPLEEPESSERAAPPEKQAPATTSRLRLHTSASTKSMLEGIESARQRQWGPAAHAFLDGLAEQPADKLLAGNFDYAVTGTYRQRRFLDRDRKREELPDWIPPPKKPLPPMPQEVEEDLYDPGRRSLRDEFEEVWQKMYLRDLYGRRDPDSIEAQTKEVFWTYYLPLKKYFIFYSRLENAAVSKIKIRERVTVEDVFTMDRREWLVFVKECRLENAVLTKAIIDIIFITSNRGLDRAGVSLVEVAENSRNSCSVNEFMVTIARMAQERFRRAAPTIARRVELVMRDFVLPHARYDRAGGFKELLRSKAIAVACRKWYPQVRELFIRYAAMEWYESIRVNMNHLTTLSVREFLKIFEDHAMVGDELTNASIQECFVLAQSDALDVPTLVAMARAGGPEGFEIPHGDAPADDPTEMELPAFFEALARCAAIWAGLAPHLSAPSAGETLAAPKARGPLLRSATRSRLAPPPPESAFPSAASTMRSARTLAPDSAAGPSPGSTLRSARGGLPSAPASEASSLGLPPRRDSGATSSTSPGLPPRAMPPRSRSMSFALAEAERPPLMSETLAEALNSFLRELTSRPVIVRDLSGNVHAVPDHIKARCDALFDAREKYLVCELRRRTNPRPHVPPTPPLPTPPALDTPNPTPPRTRPETHNHTPGGGSPLPGLPFASSGRLIMAHAGAGAGDIDADLDGAVASLGPEPGSPPPAPSPPPPAAQEPP